MLHSTCYYGSYIPHCQIIPSQHAPVLHYEALRTAALPHTDPSPAQALHYGVSVYELPAASGSYLRTISPQITHSFPLNKTSLWVSDQQAHITVVS